MYRVPVTVILVTLTTLSRDFIGVHYKVAVCSSCSQWCNDGVASASSDGGPTGGRGPPTVLEFSVINISVCLVLLSNSYTVIY